MRFCNLCIYCSNHQTVKVAIDIMKPDTINNKDVVSLSPSGISNYMRNTTSKNNRRTTVTDTKSLTPEELAAIVELIDQMTEARKGTDNDSRLVVRGSFNTLDVLFIIFHAPLRIARVTGKHHDRALARLGDNTIHFNSLEDTEGVYTLLRARLEYDSTLRQSQQSLAFINEVFPQNP